MTLNFYYLIRNWKEKRWSFSAYFLSTNQNRLEYLLCELFYHSLSPWVLYSAVACILWHWKLSREFHSASCRHLSRSWSRSLLRRSRWPRSPCTVAIATSVNLNRWSLPRLRHVFVDGPCVCFDIPRKYIRPPRSRRRNIGLWRCTFLHPAPPG